MPKLARWFIKTALLYFITALIAGLLVQARSEIDLPAWIARLHPVYIHLLTVGWLTQLIIGVALWLFPIYSREQPRGDERLGWATYILLNAGLILRAIVEPRAPTAEPDLGGLLVLSALLQALAGWLFVLNIWTRVKERP